MGNRCRKYCHSMAFGIYRCRWKDVDNSGEPAAVTTIAEKLWWWTLLLILVFTTTWLFCWSVFSNDYNDFNWFIYDAIGIWFGWGILILSIFVIIMFYLMLLVAAGITLVGSKLSRHMHLCHKITILLILTVCIVAYIMISKLWNEEMYASVIGLIMLGQWFHICLLCVITLSSWLIFYEIMRVNNKKVWIIAVFCISALFLFICFLPLFVHSPCVGDGVDDMPKPVIIAHRLGTTKYAPENTILCFEEAVKVCGDFDVETDVSISYDGVPFLFHDTNNLKRTSNVEDVFPEFADQYPELFTWEQLQKLDAGSWFLQQDPYRNVRSFSNDYKAKIQQQKIPSLYQIAKHLHDRRENQSIIFDLYAPVHGHPYQDNYTEVALQALLEAGLPESQILWLPGDNRPKIRILAPDLKMVSPAAPIQFFRSNNISIANVGYYETTPESIYNYIQNNISVIQYRIETPWLFSYAWCQGTSYVTTNSCNMLTKISAPIWTLTSGGYIAMWVCVDVIFMITFVAIFLLQYYRSNCDYLDHLFGFCSDYSSTELSGIDNSGLDLELN